DFIIAERQAYRILRVDAQTGQASVAAGIQAILVTGPFGVKIEQLVSFADGPIAVARFLSPYSVAAAPECTTCYAADTGNQRVRKVGADGNISTIAGSGPTLVTPTDGAICADGSAAPCGHYSGDGGPATSAQINLALNIAIAPNGNLFIADTANSRIREVQF